MASVPLGVSLLSPPSLAGHGSSPKAPLCSAVGWGEDKFPKHSFGAAWFVHLGKEGTRGAQHPAGASPSRELSLG